VFSVLLLSTLLWTLSKDHLPAYFMIVIAVYVTETVLMNFTSAYWGSLGMDVVSVTRS